MGKSRTVFAKIVSPVPLPVVGPRVPVLPPPDTLTTAAQAGALRPSWKKFCPACMRASVLYVGAPCEGDATYQRLY